MGKQSSSELGGTTVEKLCSRAGWKLNDSAIVGVREAFASCNEMSYVLLSFFEPLLIQIAIVRTCRAIQYRGASCGRR
jgi:hypothetical protein